MATTWSAAGTAASVAISRQRAAERLASGEKVCSRCHRLLPMSAFAVATAAADGRRWACKGCENLQRRERRAQELLELMQQTEAGRREMDRLAAAARFVPRRSAVPDDWLPCCGSFADRGHDGACPIRPR